MSAKIILKKNEERRIKSGHLWVFSNEIERREGDAENGDLIDVFDCHNDFLASGFYNKNSLIAVRILDKVSITDFKSYAENKIDRAFNLRKIFYPGRNSFRLVFSESDFMPGLIVDKYNDTFVLQIYSAGMQKYVSDIVSILQNSYNAKNIFTKNEEYFRLLEGLPIENETFLGDVNNEIINDGTINYNINFEKSHKTGFYFDQSDNRFFIEKISNGKNVLDAFCNSGGFGLHAALAGADSITFADSSSSEIDNAKNNFELNNFSNKSEFVVCDIFEYLEKSASGKNEFDVVMIDPPAFAKSKKNLAVAKKGYEKLNRLALQLVSHNGFLVTSSCSHHVSSDEFINIISVAASKVGKNIQLIHFNGASLDHPEIPAMPETVYLKFAVFRVF